MGRRDSVRLEIYHKGPRASSSFVQHGRCKGGRVKWFLSPAKMCPPTARSYKRVRFEVAAHGIQVWHLLSTSCVKTINSLQQRRYKYDIHDWWLEQSKHCMRWQYSLVWWTLTETGCPKKYVIHCRVRVVKNSSVTPRNGYWQNYTGRNITLGHHS